MDERFLSAFTDPAPVKILGRKVYPFCIRHRVILEAMGSPLLRPGTKVAASDLLAALKVLAGERVDRVTISDIILMAKIRHRAGFMEAALSRISEYVLGSAWPQFWEPARKHTVSSQSGLPWPLAVVANLISSGIPEERAWSMPECQAIWLNAAFAIGKGADIKIGSTELDEQLAALEEMNRDANQPAN